MSEFTTAFRKWATEQGRDGNRSRIATMTGIPRWTIERWMNSLKPVRDPKPAHLTKLRAAGFSWGKPAAPDGDPFPHLLGERLRDKALEAGLPAAVAEGFANQGILALAQYDATVAHQFAVVKQGLDGKALRRVMAAAEAGPAARLGEIGNSIAKQTLGEATLARSPVITLAWAPVIDLVVETTDQPGIDDSAHFANPYLKCRKGGQSGQ